MGDLISRQAVIKLIDHLDVDFANSFDPHTLNEIYRCVKELPSVENKGEWIKINSGDKDFPESICCNRCLHENSHFDFNEHNEPIGKVFITSNFCPNCGADMRGGE